MLSKPSMILNIRGTSGSGKTTVVRTLMNNYPHFNIEGLTWPDENGKRHERILGVAVEVPEFGRTTYLIGKYDNACGGMDGITTQAEQADRILKAAGRGHVVCEGLLMSSTFNGQATKQILATVGPNRVCFAFMDTPEDLCVERVKARRIADGNMKPLNETNTRQKWKDVRVAREKMLRAGYWVVDLDHRDAYSQAFEILKNYELEN